MSVTFGKANYKSSANYEAKTVYHKLGHKTADQRTLTVRIAPPYGPLGEKGIWQRYVKQHFGYGIKVVTKSGEQKFIPTTFNCIEQKDRQSNITRHCPECDEIAKQKKKLDDKTKELTAQGKSLEEIDAATRYISGWTKNHNLDKKWHLVAKNKEGVWGFLTISHTCYKFLKGNEASPGLIDKLVSRGLDPLSPEKGLWFQFTRTGEKWNEIKDLVAVDTEEVTVNGESMSKMKFDSLTQSDLDALEKLPALDTLGRDLTMDQIQMLVTSGGSEDTVRAVMNMPVLSRETPKTESQVLADEPGAEDEVTPEAVAAPAALKELMAAPAVDDEEAAALAALAAIKAKKAAKAAPAGTPAPEVTSKLAGEMNMKMEDFIAKYK